MKKQYIVKESNKGKREELYDYVVNNYDLEIHYPYTKNKFIDSNFPFVIDFKENSFWVCKSITCCACESAAGRIITIEEFKKQINSELCYNTRIRKCNYESNN